MMLDFQRFLLFLLQCIVVIFAPFPEIGTLFFNRKFGCIQNYGLKPSLSFHYMRLPEGRFETVKFHCIPIVFFVSVHSTCQDHAELPVNVQD